MELSKKIIGFLSIVDNKWGSRHYWFNREIIPSNSCAYIPFIQLPFGKRSSSNIFSFSSDLNRHLKSGNSLYYTIYTGMFDVIKLTRRSISLSSMNSNSLLNRMASSSVATLLLKVLYLRGCRLPLSTTCGFSLQSYKGEKQIYDNIIRSITW